MYMIMYIENVSSEDDCQQYITMPKDDCDSILIGCIKKPSKSSGCIIKPLSDGILRAPLPVRRAVGVAISNQRNVVCLGLVWLRIVTSDQIALYFVRPYPRHKFDGKNGLRKGLPARTKGVFFGFADVRKNVQHLVGVIHSSVT